MQGQQLKNGEHLISRNGVFELGFFSPRSSTNQYLGIWYSKLPHNPEAIWVANPENPISNKSGVFSLESDGKLKITNGKGQEIVINANQGSSDSNLTATLLDTGNFVLRQVNSDGTEGQILWQSFDYPTNNLLPGMKLGMNLKNEENWTLSSWLSNEIPRPGAFELGMDPSGAGQLIIWRRGNVYWKSGVWKNGGFKNSPELTKRDDLYQFRFMSNSEEWYFSFSVVNNNSTLSRWELNAWGQIVGFILAADGSTWQQTAKIGSCITDETYPSAMCFKQNFTSCRNESVLFVPIRGYYSNLELSYIENNTNLGISDCHDRCWNNCSCIAYESLLPDETGCRFWTKQPGFVRNPNFPVVFVLVLGNGQEQTKAKGGAGESLKEQWWFWCILAIAPGLFLLLLACCNINRIKSKSLKGKDNFSFANKLGKGGFGPVYKGTLPDGQRVAVKRLARNSGQGLEEFMNEITLIADLQHRNLVRLLGCCIQEEEKILVYEYMSNKSLDTFLFDTAKRKLLDWEKRIAIIEGIAQGLLYLHKYSRMRVIHRDLKASNILLDDDMNPKISDFGMARIFGHDETRANTHRVVGTYGYMSPEYAMNGIFSVKSDVFSFGVLLLEIVSGKKNTSFHSSSEPTTLISHAWDLWQRGDVLELKDETLESCPKNELFTCIQVALLCVQANADDRPTMSDIISLLTNEVKFLQEPKEPAYAATSGISLPLPDSKSGSRSLNYMSITIMDAR
ncbi:S-locus glycoprotein [Corchorus olitorius]|uniref:Receptor-like serine/threonine-protein kinase n=1 Tax=Corchorus olitorius TaxID=93759 RepID=A0A1R3GIW4_9ROSI|nr:S-locus glycoprotein [Corchorus olitorius]